MAAVSSGTPRTASISRKTKETEITCEINLDGVGISPTPPHAQPAECQGPNSWQILHAKSPGRVGRALQCRHERNRRRGIGALALGHAPGLDL